jgi:hypothetical protein
MYNLITLIIFFVAWGLGAVRGLWIQRSNNINSSIESLRALHQDHLICLPLSFIQGKPLILLAEIVDKLAEELLVRRG